MRFLGLVQAALLAAGIASGAHAHGLVAPLHTLHFHTTPSSSLLANLHHLSKVTSTSGSVAAGGVHLSGSETASATLYKNIAQVSIVSGAQTGFVSNGQIVDTYYTGSSPNGPFYNAGQQYVDNFGSNPLNTGTYGVTLSASPTNFFTYMGKPGSTGASGSHGGIVIPARAASGSQQAYLSQIKTVATAGIAMGTQLGSHPLGGIVVGSEYWTPSVNGQMAFTSNIALPFGNNPYNSISAPTIPAGVASYIQVSTKLTIHLSSGELLSTPYNPPGATVTLSSPNQLTSIGYYLYAIGKDPLNVASNPNTLFINPSTFKSFLVSVNPFATSPINATPLLRLLHHY